MYYILYIYFTYNICIIKKTENVSFRLLPIRHWSCGNLCNWAHDAHSHIPGTSEPKHAQQVKQEA